MISDIGISTMNSKPRSAKQIRDFPFKLADIKLLPNPSSEGGVAGGPPLSAHEKTSVGSSGWCLTSQLMSTYPFGVESDPYLAALVANSWITNANCWPNAPPTINGMPSILLCA